MYTVTTSNLTLLRQKSYCVACLLVSKVIAFVLAVFIFKPHVLQYNSMSFKSDCNDSDDFDLPK